MTEKSPAQRRVEQLQEQVATREELRDELARKLHSFRVRYRDELGPLVEELLQMRRNRTRDASTRNRRSARARNAYRDAQADYERFKCLYEEIEEEGSPSQTSLSDDEQRRLKTAYRTASKRCHPDMVDPSQKDEAERMFHTLREAYQQNDLEQVESIAQQLEQEDADLQSQMPNWGAQQEQLRQRLDKLKADIEAMRESDAYQVLTEVDNLDAYFNRFRKALKRQIDRLRRHAVSG